MTDHNQHSEQESREKVWAMIKDIRVATFVTQTASMPGQDGGNLLRARPMVAVERSGDANELWFFTPAGSGKVQEIETHSQVCLSYADPSNENYVSISGTADISHDRALIKKYWSEPMRTWFPKGAEDPSLALIRVVPEAAEYWDSPSSTLVYAYGYLKARLTGETPRPGDHDSLAM